MPFLSKLGMKPIDFASKRRQRFWVEIFSASLSRIPIHVVNLTQNVTKYSFLVSFEVGEAKLKKNHWFVLFLPRKKSLNCQLSFFILRTIPFHFHNFAYKKAVNACACRHLQARNYLPPDSSEKRVWPLDF